MIGAISEYLWSFLQTNPSTSQAMRDGLTENLNKIMQDTLLDSDVLANSDNVDLNEEDKKESTVTETKLELEELEESEPETKIALSDSWISKRDFIVDGNGSMVFFTDQNSKIIFTKKFCDNLFQGRPNTSNLEFEKLVEACEKFEVSIAVFDIKNNKLKSWESESDSESNSESNNENEHNSDDCNNDLIVKEEFKEINVQDELLSNEENNITKDDPQIMCSSITLPSLSSSTLKETEINTKLQNIKKDCKNPILSNVWKCNTIEEFLENNKDVTEEDLELVKNLYQSDKDSRESFLLQNSFFEA